MDRVHPYEVGLMTAQKKVECDFRAIDFGGV